MLKKVMEALGYTFRDEALLRRALTHPSMGKNDNQRLEFLGDAVLQYLMSDALYQAHPTEREGALTHRRQLMVCEGTLSPIAKKLGLHAGAVTAITPLWLLPTFYVRELYGLLYQIFL